MNSIKKNLNIIFKNFAIFQMINLAIIIRNKMHIQVQINILKPILYLCNKLQIQACIILFKSIKKKVPAFGCIIIFIYKLKVKIRF